MKDIYLILIKFPNQMTSINLITLDVCNNVKEPTFWRYTNNFIVGVLVLKPQTQCCIWLWGIRISLLNAETELKKPTYLFTQN